MKIGKAFVAEAEAHIVNDYLPNGQQLEQAANGKLMPMYKALEDTVTALQNAQRIN